VSTILRDILESAAESEEQMFVSRYLVLDELQLTDIALWLKHQEWYPDRDKNAIDIKKALPGTLIFGLEVIPKTQCVFVNNQRT
jgi:hypothetical protein